MTEFIQFLVCFCVLGVFSAAVLFNLFVMVHPERCFDEPMYPILLNSCTLFSDTSPVYPT